MIAHLSALSAEHDEIVEVPSSSRRTEGLPPGHRGDQGEQPLHPRGGGGTPSPLVGWAGGRWLLGGRLAVTSSIGWLLQLRGQLQRSNTEEADRCVRPLKRGAQLQEQAEAQCRGTDLVAGKNCLHPARKSHVARNRLPSARQSPKIHKNTLRFLTF